MSKTSDRNVSESWEELREELRQTQKRVAALEAGIVPDLTGGTDAFGQAMDQRVTQGMEKTGAPYGLAIANVITQRTTDGHHGTHFGIWGVEKADDLPRLDEIPDKLRHIAPLFADPLVLQCFRAFLALRFDGKPMRASAAELAEQTGGSSAERIAELLTPLVHDKSLGRELGSDEIVYYTWDGGNGLVMSVLFFA